MNIRQFLARALSLENPNTPICADTVEWATNESGQTITPDSAWNYSAVYAAVRLLSETIAQLPLQLYRKTGDSTEPATEHPLYTLIHDAPSDRQTSFVWRETQMSQTLSWGNGYAMIERSGRGDVVGLRLLSAASTYPYVAIDGTVTYQTTINDKTYTLEPRDVLHIPAVGFDGIVGKSPITLHRETLGLSQAATQFGAQFFGQGVTLGGVVKHPGRLSPQAKNSVRDSWNKFRGTGYNGVAILDEGMEYTRIGIPPEDAQFLETRRFQVSEIARIYNIPPHMLRDLEKSSFNNISEQSIEFLRYTMAPWLMKWEQELNRKLLKPSQRKEYYFKFSANALLRGTQKDRYESYGRAITDGWLSRNEVRELEDLNPVDGLDDYLVPLNMGGDPGDEADPEDNADEAIDEATSAQNAEELPEERAKIDLTPLIRQSSAKFCSWIASVYDRNSDQADALAAIAGKLTPMSERHIYPLFEAVGVTDYKQRWLDYLNTVPTGENIAERDLELKLTELLGLDYDN